MAPLSPPTRPGGHFVLFGLANGGPITATRDDVTALGFDTLGAIP